MVAAPPGARGPAAAVQPGHRGAGRRAARPALPLRGDGGGARGAIAGHDNFRYFSVAIADVVHSEKSVLMGSWGILGCFE